MIKKNIKIGVFILIFAVLVLTLSLSFVSAQYTRAVPGYTQYPSFTQTGQPDFPLFDRTQCMAGQDFILQIAPFGCTPSTVRSDLLEEQNVPVFCQISATKLNPMIDVEAINFIDFLGQFPKEVAAVKYLPARAALGRFGAQIDSPILSNLGYVTIVLRKQGNESAMPDFIEGNLNATIRYDIKNAFGVGRAVYYLPELGDEEWNERFVQYGFWDGIGYLRAESIDSEGATISIYSDRESSGLGRVDGGKRVISSVHIGVGKTSNRISIPGFDYCLGSLELKLDSLEDPDTRVRLIVNSDVTEVARGEKFLENKCTVRDIKKQGVTEKVKIVCDEDRRPRIFELSISPSIELEIGGEINEYRIGDRLYQSEKDPEKPEAPDKSVYLGFIGTGLDPAKEEDLYVSIIELEGNKPNLNEDELPSGIKLGVGGKRVDYRVAKNLFGTNIAVVGFAGPRDLNFAGELEDYYRGATEDYETILESFSTEKYPEGDIKTLGEKALVEEINLALGTEQKRTVTELCNKFKERYPDSVEPDICNKIYQLSSQESSIRDVFINGITHRILLDGISEPKLEDYGANILVKYPSGETESFDLRKNQIIYLNETENEFIQLVSVDRSDSTNEESVKVKINLIREGTFSDINRIASGTKILRKDSTGITDTFGSRYSFTLGGVNLKKSAKVSVIPSINYASTHADFNFRIGIDKRGIQLSPEKTREKIASLNSTLRKLEGLSDKLGTTVKVLKTACLGIGGFLTVKNFLANLGGKGIARQKVMGGNGGWFEICEDAVNQKTAVNGKTYDNIDSCLLGNSGAINSAVDERFELMKKQNEEIENLQKPHKKDNGFLGEEVIDTEGFMSDYVDQDFRNELDLNFKGKIETVMVGGKEIPVSNITKMINSDTTFLTQARDLQLSSRLLNSDNEQMRETAKAQITKTLGDIWVSNENDAERKTIAEKYGFPDVTIGTKPGGKITTVPIEQKVTWSQVNSRFSGELAKGINDDSYVSLFVDELEGKEYVLVLDDSFIIRATYLIHAGVSTNTLTLEDDINPLGLSYRYFDRTTYENTFINPEIRYYETDPYNGLPAIVPFDLKNGWYAAVKSTLPVGGAIRAYDESGRVSSLWLCNVGQDGKEEFNSGIGDDECGLINLGTGQPYNQFFGLSKGEASRLVDRAVSAIAQASTARARKSGISQVRIDGQSIPVGQPYVTIPDIQCQDFMSPSDCNLLFNVCDPVVCPSSRCDLDGNYPVKDVIQSGIAGSTFLCLPNFPEVKVPICLSGVHAGMEGYLSVIDSYQQCLQTSLDTGQTVGICDELHSVYMCDFFWRQTLPLAKVAAPKILGSVLGQNVRGGGEYLGVADAFETAEQSVDYFTQYYAANSYAAFKARTSEGVGGEVCKNFISAVNPQGGNLLDALTAPDVPVQFIGNFDEIPFTTATNPPISQYKVFYHIYAGKDFPAYYEVYLRDPTGSSFFQDTSFRRTVSKGFIAVGEYATETRDFTAPSGYKQLCIIVNGREECGFKQVTTDFGINYLTEQYVASQARQTDIKSQTQCVSGSPNAFSLLNPLQVFEPTAGIQEGAEEVLNPAIYNRGIIRICATGNPGQGTDAFTEEKNARWKDVGFCDNTRIRCWLDTESVRDVIRATDVENQVLGEVTDNYVEKLIKEGDFIDKQDAKNLIEEVETLNDNSEKIEKIDTDLLRIFHNNQRAYLHLLRGNAYQGLAVQLYQFITGKEPNLPEDGEDEGEDGEDEGEDGEDEGEDGEDEGEDGEASQRLSCDDEADCRKTLGNEIIKIASQYAVDDDIVKQETGAESFECLVLQVARTESFLSHCKKFNDKEGPDGDPLYCNGDMGEVLSPKDEASLGIMQINTAKHDVNAEDFETNVNFGIGLLIDGYNNPPFDPPVYKCYRPEELTSFVTEDDFEIRSYSGWQGALRDYNGWNTRCTYFDDEGILRAEGNPRYVEAVIDKREEIAELFPETCGIEGSAGLAEGVKGN